VCSSGFHFDYTLVACVTYVDCSALANSPGTNVDSLTCNCNASYVFNTTSQTCVRDCASVNQSPSLNLTNTSLCVCPSGYIYVSVYAGIAVGVCEVDCSLIDHALTTTTSGYLTCNCASGYYYSSLTCILNCTGLANSQGTNADS
jgi:hypothetical protein